MTDRPEFAPGCYGGAMTFKAESAECASCPFAPSCGLASAERLRALRAGLGPVRPEKPAGAIARAGTPGALTLPKKVAEQIDRLDRMGVKVTEALRRGVNPFGEKGSKNLRAVTHMLMLRPVGLTHEKMRDACVRKFGWTEETATSQVTQAVQLLTALGAAAKIEGRYTLTRI